MRISLNWLRELVDITMAPEELADTLTMAGFEVEDIEDRRTWAEGVVIGRVLDRQPHPNADKLSVCQVDIGAKAPSTIVCGAANVRAEIYVPVATVGSYLPKIDITIRPRPMRGVSSEGMICSLAELGLAKESEGIHIFSQETLTVGEDVRPLLGLNDVILDLTSTANRADVLSMVGVAREVAALTGASLRLPSVPEVGVEGTGTDLVLRIVESEACPLYIGTVIRGVQIAPSPEWLQRRLQAAGSRPINNVVDITNYVMLEWGQPLHAFDRDRLETFASKDSLTLGVRYARSGEGLTTLDGQSRELQEQTLLITANDQPVALAGVMGGEETEVHQGTQNLVLEAAIFDSATIRRSARSQGLRSEASARYERGVNAAELAIACSRALHLLIELTSGTLGTQVVADARPAPMARTIELRLERVNQVLGLVNLKPAALRALETTEAPLTDEDVGELQAEETERILKALGCQLKLIQGGTWQVTIPPYRYRDLEREIDLVEEIARLYGFNNFCDTLPAKTEAGYLTPDQVLTRRIHRALQAVGLTEVIHYTLGKPGEENEIVLSNPLFVEYSALRTELLSGLINAFQYNLEQGNGALNAFEIGRVFWREETGLSEMDMVAGIMGGDPQKGRWTRNGREQPMTWYEAKGMLDSVFQRLKLVIEYQPDRRNSLLHPGRTASLWVQGKRLGTFGQLHPQLRRERGLPDAAYVFELNLDVLLEQMDQEEFITPPFQPYSAYPASDRDIAFFAPVQYSVADMERSIRQAAGSLLDSVELFDEYRGENVPEGKRSLAFRIVYRAGDRTLTDEDIEPVHQKVRSALEEKFQASLRS